MTIIYIMMIFCGICLVRLFFKNSRLITLIYGFVTVVLGLMLVDAFRDDGHTSFKIITFLVFSTFCLLLFRKAFWIKSQHGKQRFHRGSSIIQAKSLKSILDKYKTRLPLGEYALPIENEVKHCFIIGRPGTGKTNVINQMINKVILEQLPAVIHDNKGSLVTFFYQDGRDYIINPFDERCAGWNIFNDIKKETDFNLFACSLIPESVGEAYWYEAPRKILADILSYCWHCGKRTNKDLWQVLSWPINELAELLKGQRSNSYIDLIGNEKTAANLMSILLSKCRIFYYMQHIEGKFSVTEWLNANKGLIFLTNQADIKDTVKPILTLFIDICSSKLLSLTDNNERRVFFFLDEFGSLARINNIINLLTLSRSKGGSVFIGIQDIGNIEQIYGRELRQTIVNACGNSIIFAVEDPDTAEFLSKKIGDTEYYETMESTSLNKNSRTVSNQEEKRNERIMLASEIQQIKDKTAIIKIANVGTSVTSFNYVSWSNMVPSFIESKHLLLDATENTVDDVATLELEGV